MRRDMGRLSVDMPRAGSRTTKGLKTRLKIDPRKEDEFEIENSPSRLGRRHQLHGWDKKSQGDYLSPMYRFLEKAVGRKWDDVYSEIRRVTSIETVSGRHLLTHIKDEVGRGPYQRRYAKFYIDDNGVLCKNKREPHVVSYKGIEKIEISETLHLELRNGFWFAVTFVKHLPGEIYRKYRNEDGNTIVERYKAVSLEATSCKQLSKKATLSVGKILSATRVGKHHNFRNPLVLHCKNQYGTACIFFVDRRVLRNTNFAARDHRSLAAFYFTQTIS